MDLMYLPAVLCAVFALAFAAGSAVLHARVSTRRWPWQYRGRHHVSPSRWSMLDGTGSVRRGQVAS